jgi:lysylphosphatidylglycerol synthetase-like protein (DUF2156 family)
MEFADLLMADPAHDPEAGPEGRHLRQHLNRARRLGVTVREYNGSASPDPELEAEAETACEQWRSGRHGFQIYLGRPRLFADRWGRRWFIAESGADKLAGVLSMLRVSYPNCSNMINLVFSAPHAPTHTSEMLVVTALRSLREQGARLVCLGIGPRATLGATNGFPRFSARLARLFYAMAAKPMHLHGKTEFWEKYGIVKREPLYLLFRPPRIGGRQLAAILRAFHFSRT